MSSTNPLRRLGRWLKALLGWRECPRCRAFVLPRYLPGGHRWECPNCYYRN